MFETSALRRVDHVTMATDYIRQELISRFGIEASRTTQVYMAIDMDGITSSIRVNSGGRTASQNKIVLCAARIHPRKNQLAVVRAIPRILHVHPEVKFVFTGPIDDPAYLSLMRKFIEDNQLSEQVEITGEISQESLYQLYHKATIFVFPTLYEIQPVALLEAMAFGLPVIASRIGPIEDVVNLEKGSAILVDPNNIEEIADSVIRLLGDEPLRQELSAKGKKLVSQGFSYEQIAKEMLRVYEKVLL
jgi:glycosyltransferase involved in cell wall biosynthesis